MAGIATGKFQSYQSKQRLVDQANELRYQFQSYQFRQIKPDAMKRNTRKLLRLCFNRINSDRSIQTLSWFNQPTAPLYMFQSYQSRQINPDNVSMRLSLIVLWSFNRINPNSSIPTLKTRFISCRWYSCFNRINPDRSIPTQHLWEFPWRVCRVSIVSI